MLTPKGKVKAKYPSAYTMRCSEGLAELFLLSTSVAKWLVVVPSGVDGSQMLFFPNTTPRGAWDLAAHAMETR